MKAPTRVLIVKLSSLGDVIQSIPVVRDLLCAFPGVELDWVTEEAYAPLVRGCVSGLARVIPAAERRWRHRPFSAQVRAERRLLDIELQAAPYDAVIDLQGLLKSALIARRARLSRAGHRYVFGNASEDCGYEWPVRYLSDRPVPMPLRMHAVQRYRYLAAKSFGYTPSAVPVYALECEGAPRSFEVVLAHGTTRPENEWPFASWVALGRRLAALGWTLSVPHATAAEETWGRALCAEVGARAQVLPRMTLEQLPQRMASAGGVIGVDSGLSHLAVALGLPHVQIFSQPRAWRAGPFGSAHQVAVGGAEAPAVGTVWEAWRSVWQAACRALPAAA